MHKLDICKKKEAKAAFLFLSLPIKHL